MRMLPFLCLRRGPTSLGVLALTSLLLLGPPVQAEDAEGSAPFPSDGLMPKVEIGVDRFLAAHPEADGRGITVAIFDTGVDPGAPGLQTTPDGRPKIIDLVDGSGSGDVDTSATCKLKDGKLKGLSGRLLTIGKHACPSGEWHVGLKPAYEMFPGGLVARLKKKRGKHFREKQRVVHAELMARLMRARRETDNRTKLRDLRAKLKQLEALLAGYEDPGPIYDCVVFHDGTAWRALIDTDEDGDLGDEKAMANYRLERQWSTFSSEDRLNYGINIYEDGKRLSIVVDCGAHGTHVAGTVAAYYPERPELNGMAPGAQIVAVKIGDTRMGSSSMGTGEERGLAAVRQHKCDLINMSYGGPTATPNRARLDRLYAEVVNEQNVIFVAAAGNEGPALSTVIAPGGTTTALFGVGAYVSPRMMQAQYAMRKPTRPTHYTWSSRGPTADGALGVDFSAPGGGVAPVPNWLLQGSTHMNGTSMASPNLCGGVALLLSALKQKGLAWSPHRIHRALSNTAKRIDGIGVFGLGRGLVQIPEALDYIERWQARPEEDVRFELTLPKRGKARGLYLREPAESERVAVERVQVKPHFPESADHAKRIGFSMRLRLQATQPWIDVADHLALQHGGGRFEIRVDPRELEAGRAHYGEVHGIDVDHPERGAIFRLPVTVVRPEPVQDQRFAATLDLAAGTIVRRFFAVPEGATWADLRLHTVKADSARLLVLQTQQLIPGHTSGEDVYEKYLGMDPGETSVHSFKVTGGRTLEVALAQYWSSLGAGTFDVELVFHGLVPSSQVVRVPGTELLSTLDVTVPFGRERLKPKVSLKTLRRALRPTSFELRAGDPARDKLTKERLCYQAILTYPFELKDDAKVQPRGFHTISDEIYEEWSSGIWMLFDKNKRRVAKGPLSGDETVSLKEGSYVLRLHVRHQDPKMLESVRHVPLLLDLKLSKPPSVAIHADGASLVRGGAAFKSREVEAGDRIRLYLKPPTRKAMGKLAETGDVLLGDIRFGEEIKERFGKGRRPGGWPIWISVGPARAEHEDEKKAGAIEDGDPTKKGTTSAKPTPYDDVVEAVFKQRLAHLEKLRKAKEAKAFDRLAAALLHEAKGSVPVLLEKLKWADRESATKQDPKERARVIAAADALMARIDQDRLAQYRGSGVKPKTKAEKRLDRRMTMRVAALAQALHRKARALSLGGASSEKAFRTTWTELTRWADVESSTYLGTRVRYARVRGRLVEALAAVSKRLEKYPLRRPLYETRMEILEALGWHHWAQHERAWLSIRFPAAYPPF